MIAKPPIGYSDFRELRENGRLYVDKSGLISDIIQDSAQVILFPRPRRFGKTLNLSLVRYFFQRDQQDLSSLFEDLEVWKDADARQHFQRYPTIFVTFKDVAARDYPGTLEGVREVVRQTYESHRYLLDAGSLTPEQAERYRTHLRAEASEVVLCGALPALAEHLVNHHGERVLVLIDEYDTPIQQGYFNRFHDEVVTLFRNLFSALLKDNANVYRGILTGIFRIARESLFSGLNNLAVRSLLDSAYSTRFGFTEDEVARVIAGTTRTVLNDELRAWYDGYCFGGEVIYNPWSVLCYAETGKLRAHWASTSSNELIRKLMLGRGLTLASQVELLLRGGTIDKSIDENVVLRDLDQKPDALWSFLTFSGYLKATDLRERGTDLVATLAIPNRDVSSVYREVFKAWLAQRPGGGEGSPSEEVLWSWLHLSDFHADHGHVPHGWDQKAVLAEIAADVFRVDALGIPQPDAIFVTGDMAFSTASRSRQEYRDAAAWLRQVAASHSISDQQIFVVPGKHDVQCDLGEPDSNLRRLLAALRSGTEGIDDALANPTERGILVDRFENYIEFAKEFGQGQHCCAGDELFRVWRFPVANGRLVIGIVGLNTALLCLDDDDFGRLGLGTGISAALDSFQRQERPDMVIVLSHHPLAWLRPSGEEQGWIRKHAHLHLVGHLQEANGESRRAGSGSEVPELVAGPTQAETADVPAAGAYSFGSLVLTPDGPAVRIWPRKWSPKNSAFRTDVENVPDGQSYSEHRVAVRPLPVL